MRADINCSYSLSATILACVLDTVSKNHYPRTLMWIAVLGIDANHIRIPFICISVLSDANCILIPFIYIYRERERF